MKKKILFVTMDCWNDYNSSTTANTFSTLFEDYEPEYKASLFLREEIPTSNQCSYYFGIFENKVIRSLLNRYLSTGKLYVGSHNNEDEDDLNDINQTKKRYKKYSNKRNYFLLMIRELIWLFGKWKTKELKEFLKMYDPDIIIYGMEGYIFFHRIVRFCIKNTNAKGVGYFWDDNFTYKQRKNNIGYVIYRYFQRRTLKRTAKMTSKFFSISEKTKRESDAFFSIDSEVLTKPIKLKYENIDIHDMEKKDKLIKIVYTGNLKVGRFNTLRLISDILYDNKKIANKVRFLIYTATHIDRKELEKLNPSIQFMNPVPQSEVASIQQQADLLLLMEDIVGYGKKIARLSFSTKITDYLSSGKCILAIGDETLASMEFLSKYQCALCASSSENLVKTLNMIIENPDITNECVENAKKVCLELFSEKVTKQKLESSLDITFDN